MMPLGIKLLIWLGKKYSIDVIERNRSTYEDYYDNRKLTVEEIVGGE